MRDWLARMHTAKREGWCFTVPEAPLPGTGRALALAPHPDDPEAIAVTLRGLHQGGWKLHWTIVTSGWSGVEDSFAGPDREIKARVREAEQRASAARFGLSGDQLAFLRLGEDEAGQLAPSPENRSCLFAYLDQAAPDLTLLPHGDDTNASHRLVYRWFTEWAGKRGQPVLALGNQDPKTLGFHADFQLTFDKASADWKASLLECHRSQSARNRALRGITFAERILATNRCGDHHAERFQVAVWQARI